MPLCGTCKKTFPNRQKVDGTIRNLKNRIHCLECIPFGERPKHYNMDSSYKIMKPLKTCLKPDCNNPARIKYCSKTCSRRHNLGLKRDKFKKGCVEYKGGKCEHCGYTKSISALQFHHKDPKEKLYEISREAHRRPWESVKAELDKCLMLCANCHIEEHDKLGRKM